MHEMVKLDIRNCSVSILVCIDLGGNGKMQWYNYVFFSYFSMENVKIETEFSQLTCIWNVYAFKKSYDNGCASKVYGRHLWNKENV